jgi:8-amino-7-oxononanoate synthase
MYEKELLALQKVGRFRERKQFSATLVDLASNDYLGLAHNKTQLQKAMGLLEEFDAFAPKASMLVNGYHEIHARFEALLCKLQGFEAGLTVGSGFLANLALIEALVRKQDRLFMDEEYHASGVMATKMLGDRVIFFKHNDPLDLEAKLKVFGKKRNIIAVEGVYSMSGSVCRREIFDIADATGSLLIVDEAHSVGVLGERLLGVFDHYHITPQANHIKMGTLGKAYGSYGAYILASKQIVSFLENRAKPIIYSTAPSVIDTTLGYVNVKHMTKQAQKYREKIVKRQDAVKQILGIETQSLIVPIVCASNQEVLALQQALIREGFLVGAIRQPTVKEPILRFIANVGVRKKWVVKALEYINANVIQ